MGEYLWWAVPAGFALMFWAIDLVVCRKKDGGA